jgi:bifunctional ADP-heptose synthase (sugar kinase/adenylyltransferase)
MRAVYGGKDVSNAAWEDYLEAAKILGQKANTKVCMTFGKKGNAFYDGQKVIHIPVYDIQGEKDFVGAGDTFLSALSTALGTGALGADAAAFANYASCITIKKIGTTGTASQTEILDMYDRHMKEMS